MAPPHVRRGRRVPCVVEEHMNDLTSKDSSWLLAAGGAGFLALAAIFLVRDLALPPEMLMGAAALLAAIAAVLGRRRWPAVGPGALLGVALAGGAWYAAVKSPALLPALGIAAAASIAVVAMHERHAGVTPPVSTLAGPLAWYAAGASFLIASAAFYFQFLTIGVASDMLARRLILTIAWLAIGLGLLIAARRPTTPPGRVGVALIAVALLKALVYDSTHLWGPLRVTVFAAVGALLLAGARLINDRGRA
jgi:hypothetical protein